MDRAWLRRSFVLVHVTLGLVVLIESALAIVHSLRSPTVSQLNTILPWFAGLESLAAVLFLIPQTLKVGGVILLLIFLAALVVHGPADGMPLMVYAAGVIFVMVHGSAYSSNDQGRSDR